MVKLYTLCKNPILVDALETHICNKLNLNKAEYCINIVVNLEKNCIYFNINKCNKEIVYYNEDPFSIKLHAIIDAFNKDIDSKHKLITDYVIGLVTERLFPKYIEYSNKQFFKDSSKSKYTINVDIDQPFDSDYIKQVFYYDDFYKSYLRSIIKDTFNIEDINSLRIHFAIINEPKKQLVISIKRM